ncbi:unnamed protein product [Linum trigynum]|uniref:Reverse transcriptase zinc-binding domain-containing protein n=1 Tax=Linum trigynum TaxID=586398 RepID=A0AAV2CHK1_9ROSI
MWMVFYKKILTLDNLKKRGFNLPNRCALCKDEEESVNHLFVSCTFANETWNLMRPFVRIEDSICKVSDVADRLMIWQHHKPADPSQWSSRVFLHAFCWKLWLERNSRVFSDSENSPYVVAFKIACAISQWLAAAAKVDREVTKNWLEC